MISGALIPCTDKVFAVLPVYSVVVDDKPLGQEHFQHLKDLSERFDGRLSCLDLWWKRQVEELGLAKNRFYVVFRGEHFTPSLEFTAELLRAEEEIDPDVVNTSVLEHYCRPCDVHDAVKGDGGWFWTWTFSSYNPLLPSSSDNGPVGVRLFA
jgi:hypothetical protein